LSDPAQRLSFAVVALFAKDPFFAMSAKTIFQRIIDREIPSRIEHEDEHCVVIRDIQPQAPVHLLIVPKKPIARVDQADASDEALLGRLLLAAQTMAKKLNLAKGFRLVINNGPDACESVPHLHVHLLAGRQMKWPPG
jgi:histidine triad (HIT) family protein